MGSIYNPVSQVISPATPATPPVTTSIINACSTGGQITFDADAIFLNAKKSLSGAVVANVLKKALSLTTTSGYLTIAALLKNSIGTAQIIRMKITLDAVVVFDASTASSAGADKGLIAVGSVSTNATTTQVSVVPQSGVYFSDSCLIEFSSDTAIDNFMYTMIAYHLT